MLARANAATPLGVTGSHADQNTRIIRQHGTVQRLEIQGTVCWLGWAMGLWVACDDKSMP